MNEQALRVALRQPEAWATLTDHQSRVVRLFIDRRSVSQVARDLGVSRQAVLDALRLAGNKFREFAKRVSD